MLKMRSVALGGSRVRKSIPQMGKMSGSSGAAPLHPFLVVVNMWWAHSGCNGSTSCGVICREHWVFDVFEHDNRSECTAATWQGCHVSQWTWNEHHLPGTCGVLRGGRSTQGGSSKNDACSITPNWSSLCAQINRPLFNGRCSSGVGLLSPFLRLILTVFLLSGLLRFLMLFVDMHAG